MLQDPNHDDMFVTDFEQVAVVPFFQDEVAEPSFEHPRQLANAVRVVGRVAFRQGQVLGRLAKRRNNNAS